MGRTDLYHGTALRELDGGFYTYGGPDIEGHELKGLRPFNGVLVTTPKERIGFTPNLPDAVWYATNRAITIGVTSPDIWLVVFRSPKSNLKLDTDFIRELRSGSYDESRWSKSDREMARILDDAVKQRGRDDYTGIGPASGGTKPRRLRNVNRECYEILDPDKVEFLKVEYRGGTSERYVPVFRGMSGGTWTKQRGLLHQQV